jgi:hypothetical protein
VDVWKEGKEMSEKLKSAREFAEAIAEWVQGGSPLDDVAVEHLAGFIISRAKLIEEAARLAEAEWWWSKCTCTGLGTHAKPCICMFCERLAAICAPAASTSSVSAPSSGPERDKP